MAAARWDIRWDRGGSWQRRLVRRDILGTVLGLGAPCVMELRRIDDPSTVPPVQTLTAVMRGAGADATLTADQALIEAFPLRRYQHRIIVSDLASGLPLLLIRGYVSIRDKVED